MDKLDNHDNEIKIIQEFQNVYSPSTILGIFANALRTPADNRIILAKGEYQAASTSREYGGYFYDEIKSTNDNKFIKAKIPSLLRSKLENNFIYVFKGYIEKNIKSSSIDLLFVVDEILQKEENPISEEDIKRFEIMQKKVAIGYKNLEAIVKNCIYKNKSIRIVNIYGNTAIVNRDFDAGLGEAKLKYDIKEYRCNLSAKNEIVNLLRSINPTEIEAIAIVRGGGNASEMEIFNDPEIGEEVIKLKPLFVTALGHVADVSLLDKIADKKFHLPHDYGNSLKVWLDEATAEQAKSKSLFIEQVKKDLTKTFEDQIKTKDESLKILQKNNEETIKQINNLNLENKKLSEQILSVSKRNSKLVIYILIAIIIGFIIGLLL